MYSRVPECQITTYYYVGFAYLMMRRYQDAIRVFANILLYIQRTRNMFQRSTYKYEMVSVHYVVPRHWVILCQSVIGRYEPYENLPFSCDITSGCVHLVA